MRHLRVEASAIVPAPRPVVYDLIADYKVGHPSILPSKYFENLVVDEGGRGAGTRIHYTMKAFGSKETSYAYVTEPEPGRVLVETVEGRGIVTTFTVDPLSGAQCRVTFVTEYPTSGVRGWIESLIVPGYLRKVYAAELAQLSERAMAIHRGGT
jgi:hypothetical protein